MIVKSALIILLVMFLGFVAWMNLTPGHFQLINCGKTIEYAEGDWIRLEKCIVTENESYHIFNSRVVNFLNLVDFNK